MVNTRKMCELFVALFFLGCAVPVIGITGFRNENIADPRRQLSYIQQEQIFSDVQQNHHRFGLQQSASNDFIRQPHLQNNFSPPSPQTQQPIPFSQNTQQFVVQQSVPFRSVPQQASPPITQSQIPFQLPLNENNQAFLPQPTLNQQPQQANLQFQQPLPQVKDNFYQQTLQSNGHQQSNQIPLQSLRTNQQILPQPTLHSFLPTIPTPDIQQQNNYNFQDFRQNSPIISSNIPETLHVVNPPSRQNQAQIAFQNTLGPNPLFSSSQSTQLQSLLEEERQQDLERLRDLQERQKIIQKHKLFLERQQQKQQQKVQKLHEDFTSKQKKKQEEIYATARPISDFTQNTQSKPREILQHEIDLFKKAVKQHEQLHPTTTPLTTTTKAAPRRPSTKSRTRQRAKSRSENDNQELYIQANRQKIYKQLKSILNENGEEKIGDADTGDVVPNKLQYVQKQDILNQLKLAIAENSDEINGKNFTSREISLPNGEKFEVIKTTDPNLIAGATPLSGDNSASLSQRISSSLNQITATKPTKQSKISFEDLTKDVLPPGADYEIIKQGGNGKLEDVGKIPISDQKKVTFVFIEEQNDGTYKVKGVKGNDDSKDSVPDVDSILTRIKDGELQLPPVTKRTKVPAVTKAPFTSPSVKDSYHSSRTVSSTHATRPPTTVVKSTTPRRQETTFDHFEATKLHSPVTTTPRYYNSPSPSSLSINHNGSPSSVFEDYDSTTYPTTNYFKSTQAQEIKLERNIEPSSSPYTQSPPTTVNGHQMYTPLARHLDQSSGSTYNNHKAEQSGTTYNNHNTEQSGVTYNNHNTEQSGVTYNNHNTEQSGTTYNNHKTDQPVLYSQTPSLASPTSSSYSSDSISIFPSSSTYYPSTNLVPRSTTSKSVPETAGSHLAYTSSHPGLIEILKENGLFATAKYLKQSGLDTILNETGPYTVFAPTDKAFRTLLIQLGGPDKAEEKFKENPRLLSGLLLHHVIPGSFEIAALQDEMTGVSLAGTQLRVNQYDMHDVEWNEIKVTTVNGARVISEKQDIHIPQGIAHAVDRVMFPLPVGDIVQTLQADRERRFTNFLKALFSSGLADSLTGSDSKTFTVFAPTDRAFAGLTSEELHSAVTDKERAKELVMKHVSPGTLFSAGMRYYQVKDSIVQGKPITLQKTAGRIKVNAGHVITHNIPATNGVIHAVDTLL